MELLLEFLFLIPEMFFDMLGISGLTANSGKGRHFSEEEPSGMYLIARRMADMSLEDRKRVIRFNNVSFLVIALGTFGIGILTMLLMNAVSGWFWILGVVMETILAVLAYRCWKKKALEMTAIA
jgi:hypothetical protein